MLIKLMLNWAFLNLSRNKKRSFITAFGIATAICSVLLMQGFAKYSYDGLSERFARSGNGHIQIGSENAFNAPSPEKFKTSKNRLDELRDLILNDEEINKQIDGVSLRRKFSGLIGTSNGSEIFQGYSIEPIAYEEMTTSQKFNIPKGLKNIGKLDVVLGKTLADKMDIKMGDSVSLLVSTDNGRTNAMDFNVAGFVETGSSQLDAVYLISTISETLNLLDSNDVDVLMIGLKNTAQTEFINNKIKQKYATYFSKQPQLAAKNWEELSDYYQSVKQLYERILGTIKIILCVIAILAVSNSMLLIIHERRGEIGMLKAIGMKNSQILNIFIFEGAFLGIVGAVIGSFLAILFSLIVSAVGGIPMPPPPGSTQGYSLKFYLTFSEGFNVCILFILCIAMASFLAARKSIKLNIPIALASSLLFIFISVLSLSYEKKMFAHDLNTNIQNTSKQNETLFSAKEIFAKWEKLRGVAKDNFITETTFKNIDTTEEIKDKNPSIIYRVAVSSDFVLAVSISDKPGERMAILSSRDGLWLQKENMRKPMRVSPAQRLLGQASNGDVVGLKWARDYFPTEYINGVLIIKPLENTKSAAYGKIELDWDEKQEKASSARFFALSGKLLKTINYTYEGKGKLMKLKTALIQDAINHSLQTLVSFSETESSEFSSHFFNPQIILESMKKIIDFKRE